MNVLIFGFGSHGGGFAAADYYLSRGDSVRITDRSPRSNFGESVDILRKRGAHITFGRHVRADFEWADLVIKSPAIPSNHPMLSLSKKIGNDFTALFSFPDINKINLVMITGTKGKTTTSSAVAYVLNKKKKETLLCGNIGISAFSVLKELEDRKEKGIAYPEYIVCELSSWQIADTYKYADTVPEASLVCLTSFFEDHQNYYHSMEAYIKDKMLLFSFPAKKIVSFQGMRKEISKAGGVPLSKIGAIEKMGKNAPSTGLIPAVAVLSALGIRSDRSAKALATFPGVPHRNEFVRFVDGTIFVNDSAATVPQAVNFTVENYYYGNPLFLICGGTDKELQPEPMLGVLKHSKSIFLLDGSFTRTKLVPLLQENNIAYEGPFSSMEEAFAEAFMSSMQFSSVNTGNPAVVLLSPGAASFELFKHEFDRGDRFRACVMEIAGDK